MPDTALAEITLRALAVVPPIVLPFAPEATSMPDCTVSKRIPGSVQADVVAS